MKEQSLLYFHTINDFDTFYHSYIDDIGWSIGAESMNYRGEEIRGTRIYNFFVDKFRKMSFFRRDVSIAEIVSFIDTIVFVKRLSDTMKEKLPLDVALLFEISLEYRINLSKNRRIDCIIRNGSKLLIMEFRLSNSFDAISKLWFKKQQELMVYKELMRNYLNDKFKLILFAFVGMPEVRNNMEIVKNVKYNNDNIVFLFNYIVEYMLD